MPTSTLPAATTRAAPGLSARPAGRLQPPSWRDPRLVVGLVLVLGSVVAGGWVVRDADHTVPVYAARHEMTPGDPVTAADLTVTRVRLGSGSAAYLAAGSGWAPSSGAVVLRSVRAGELVPRSAIGDRDEVDLRPVSIPVEPEVAQRLGAGVLVDVWVAPRRGDSGEAFERPHLAASGVEVSSTTTEHGALGSSTTSAVHLLLGPALVPDVIEAVDNQARITLVPVPATLHGAHS